MEWLEIIFFTPGIFCYGEDFKGTVERDFHESSPYGPLSHTLNILEFGFKFTDI
jgi:hypothetical protein